MRPGRVINHDNVYHKNVKVKFAHTFFHFTDIKKKRMIIYLWIKRFLLKFYEYEGI